MKWEQHRERRSTGDREDERFDIFSFNRECRLSLCTLREILRKKNDKMGLKVKERWKEWQPPVTTLLLYTVKEAWKESEKEENVARLDWRSF